MLQPGLRIVDFDGGTIAGFCTQACATVQCETGSVGTMLETNQVGSVQKPTSCCMRYTQKCWSS